jgi:tetratricopeptide (TPR) repeat protein
MVLENIRKMDELHRGIADNVHIVDRKVSIMYCIGVSDLLVSDESSVLIEASLHGVPSLAVKDWLIPDRQPPRPVSIPFENVQKTTRSALHKTVEALLADPAQARSDAIRLRNHHFSHFGQSSKLAVDLIEAAWAQSPLPFAPLQTPPAALDQILYRQAEHCLVNDDIPGATSILARLIAKDSDCWQAFNDMGGICFNQRDIEGALTLLQRAVEKEGKPGLALRNLAATQLNAGLWDDALLNYARLLHESPDDEQSRENLAGLIAGEFELSQTACEEMLKVLCNGER